MSLTQLQRPEVRLVHPPKSFGAKVSVSGTEMAEVMRQLRDLGVRDEGGNKKTFEFKTTAISSSKDKVNFYFFAGEHDCSWTDILWCWGKHNREFEMRISISSDEDFKEDIKAMHLYRLVIETFALFYPKINENRELYARLKKPLDLKQLFESITVSHTAIKHIIKTSPLLHSVRLLARLEDLASELDDELDDLLTALGLTNSLLKGNSKEMYKKPISEVLMKNPRLCEACEDFVMLERDEVFISSQGRDK